MPRTMLSGFCPGRLLQDKLVLGNWCWVWGQAKSNSRNNEVIVHEVMSDFTAFADVKIDQAAPLPNPMEYL